MIQLTNYSLQVEIERRGRSRKWVKEEQQGTFIGVYFPIEVFVNQRDS